MTYEQMRNARWYLAQRDRHRAAILSVLHRRLWWFRFVSKEKQNVIADDLMGAIDTGI